MMLTSQKTIKYIMSKTKMIVKDNQILVDVEVVFKEIEAAGGDWKKVRDEFMSYLKDLKVESGDEDQLVFHNFIPQQANFFSYFIDVRLVWIKANS